jgi:histidinol-phosphate aminotransferase
MHFKEYIASLPPYKPPKLIRQQPSGVIKLSSNENPLGPSPRALAAILAAAAQVHRYPDAGSLALRQALAARFGVSPEMVICTNGSDEMVFLLCLAFLREGDQAVMAHGSFISYYLRTLEMGGQALRVPLRDYAHDLDAMADAITDRTRLLFLCNPNNPTGTTNSAAEVARLLARGLTNRQVAESLVITEKTAKNHVARVLDKLGVNSRAEVAARAEEFHLRP